MDSSLDENGLTGTRQPANPDHRTAQMESMAGKDVLAHLQSVHTSAWPTPALGRHHYTPTTGTYNLTSSTHQSYSDKSNPSHGKDDRHVFISFEERKDIANHTLSENGTKENNRNDTSESGTDTNKWKTTDTSSDNFSNRNFNSDIDPDLNDSKDDEQNDLDLLNEHLPAKKEEDQSSPYHSPLIDKEEEDRKDNVRAQPIEENDLDNAWMRFKYFEEFRRSEGHSMKQFVQEWESRLSGTISTGCCVYSDLGLAFKILEQADLDRTEIQQVMDVLRNSKSFKTRLDQPEPLPDHQQDQSKRVRSPLLILAINYLKALSSSLKTEPNGADLLFDTPDDPEPEEDGPRRSSRKKDSHPPPSPLSSGVKVEISDSEYADYDDEEGIDFMFPDVEVSCQVYDGVFPASSRKRNKKRRHKKVDKEVPVEERKVYPCPECGKTFTRADHVKRHMQIHSRPPIQRECKLCFLKFNDKAELKEHKRSAHPEAIKVKASPSSRAKSELSVMCHVCTKTFARPEYLKIHLRQHTGERPFQCHMCEKAYPDKTSLNNHLVNHKGTKPYVCDDCGKAFPQNSRLTRHKATHSGERPHKCEVCGLAFLEKSKLKRHIETHSGSKPYGCDLCGKMFGTMQNLRQHEKTHLPKKRPKENPEEPFINNL